jgi:hypothetical protein
MGIDFLDCRFRIEKAFKLRHHPRAFDLRKLNAPLDERGRPIVTCARMLQWVELTLTESGHDVPEDCWPRLRECIAATVGASVEEVTLESRLVQDLGFT